MLGGFVALVIANQLMGLALAWNGFHQLDVIVVLFPNVLPLWWLSFPRSVLCT